MGVVVVVGVAVAVVVVVVVIVTVVVPVPVPVGVVVAVTVPVSVTVPCGGYARGPVGEWSPLRCFRRSRVALRTNAPAVGSTALGVLPATSLLRRTY